MKNIQCRHVYPQFHNIEISASHSDSQYAHKLTIQLLNFRVEHSTAEYFIKNSLAPKSYKKIMEETKEIQERMKETFGFGLQPKNKVQ